MIIGEGIISKLPTIYHKISQLILPIYKQSFFYIDFKKPHLALGHPVLTYLYG